MLRLNLIEIKIEAKVEFNDFERYCRRCQRSKLKKLRWQERKIVLHLQPSRHWRRSLVWSLNEIAWIVSRIGWCKTDINVKLDQWYELCKSSQDNDTLISHLARQNSLTQNIMISLLDTSVDHDESKGRSRKNRFPLKSISFHHRMVMAKENRSKYLFKDQNFLSFRLRIFQSYYKLY